MNKKYISLFAGAGLIVSLALAVPAFAQTQSVSANANVSARVGGNGGMFRGGPGPATAPGIFGTVTSVSGNTLMVTSRGFRNNFASSSTASVGTAYTVDATNAKIYKNSTSTTSISAIATGDMVMVQGTITGTNVVATAIHDGLNPTMAVRPGMFMGGKHSSSTMPNTPVITGNGEPVIGGSITAISGSSVTVTTKTNIVYTVDASNAKLIKNGTSTAIANIATGDNVVVQGTVNGTSVTASSIIDQGGTAGASGTSQGGKLAGKAGGILGVIGTFFQHLFGF